VAATVKVRRLPEGQESDTGDQTYIVGFLG
jgi:hypothetical protein